MCYNIPSLGVFFILNHQHIIIQMKRYLTCKHDILQTRGCKGGHIKMVTVVKIGFTFVVQLVFPVISLSNYKDQWSTWKFNTTLTSSPIDVYISSVSSSWYNWIIWSLILYKSWEWYKLISKKLFETRQSEQIREGLM